ncbi:MAG: hypothetical protein Roseis2KO_40900 [Roseivirga sp.]
MKGLFSICLFLLLISCSSEKNADIIYIDVLESTECIINGTRAPFEELEQTLINELERLETKGYARNEVTVDFKPMPSVRMGTIVEAQTILKDLKVRKVMYGMNRDFQPIDPGEAY